MKRKFSAVKQSLQKRSLPSHAARRTLEMGSSEGGEGDEKVLAARPTPPTLAEACRPGPGVGRERRVGRLCGGTKGLDPFAGCAARALYASCLERAVPPSPAGGARDLR